MEKNNEYIAGPRACYEGLKFNAPISKLYVGKYINIKANNNVRKIIEIAQKYHVKIDYCDKKQLDKISFGTAHQGIIAKTNTYNYSSIKEILQLSKNKEKSLVVVLDHIKDSGNLGAIARSAEAFGSDGIIIANSRAANISASSYKSSAGAICNIKIARVANICAAVKTLQDNDYWVAAASEHSDKNIWDENMKGKIALVMGAEHDGISSLVLKNCDFHLALPLSGKIESLNVAQAFSACAYEWVRQNNN